MKSQGRHVRKHLKQTLVSLTATYDQLQRSLKKNGKLSDDEAKQLLEIIKLTRTLRDVSITFEHEMYQIPVKDIAVRYSVTPSRVSQITAAKK